ncbi:MAG: hypothetical protein AAF732_15710 [Pseudomonadota bacterium]
MRKPIIGIVCVLATATSAGAQTHFDATTYWRQNAKEHFFNDKCCFCRAIDGSRAGHDGTTQYRVGSRWYTIPDTFIKSADPDNPKAETFICDPIKGRGEQFLCVIPGVGT